MYASRSGIISHLPTRSATEKNTCIHLNKKITDKETKYMLLPFEVIPYILHQSKLIYICLSIQDEEKMSISTKGFRGTKVLLVSKKPRRYSYPRDKGVIRRSNSLLIISKGLWRYWYPSDTFVICIHGINALFVSKTVKRY